MRAGRLLRRMLLLASLAGGFLMVTAGEAAAQTILVNTAEDDALTDPDDGDCSLSEALYAADADTPQDECPAGSSSGADTITFSIAGSDHTIERTDFQYPNVGTNVTVDGTSDPDVPRIELDGSATTSGRNAFDVTGSNATIKGFVIRNFSRSGISVSSTATNATIIGNYLGTNATGTAAAGNGYAGIEVNGGTGHQIGGSGTGEGNVISGNGAVGLEISGSSFSLSALGNRIGTSASGLTAVPNPLGVRVDGTPAGPGSVVFGGSNPTWENVISGNTGAGVELRAGDVWLRRNFIGVGADGSTAVPNGGPGVQTVAFDPSPPSNLMIGSVFSDEGNLIANNGGDGVHLPVGQGNTLLYNSIRDNAGLGIDLGTEGPTLNDPMDADTGSNDLQNFPVVSSAVVRGDGSVRVDGTLHSLPNETFRIDAYKSAACDPSGHGEGGAPFGLGALASTDSAGNAAWSLTTPAGTANTVDFVVTAAATDYAAGTDTTNTSEFSACRQATAETFTVNSVNDPGVGTCDTDECTLREAIAAAEAAPGRNTVAFSIAGNGPHTITLSGTTGALEVINDPISIDGTTEPNFDQDTDVPIVVLDGQNISGHGLEIAGGNSAVMGLVIQDFGSDGIRLTTEDFNAIQGNYIGTTANGNAADGNGTGITAASGSESNLIGGTSAPLRNVISGNTSQGIQIEADTNAVLGNYVGLGADGTTDVGNGSNGIFVSSANANTIGGTSEGARNVISGNESSGVNISGTSSNNVVEGNYVGVDAAGTTARPNVDGVFIAGSAAGNRVGGSTTAGACAGSCNVISGNTVGVALSSGTSGSPNLVRGNFIGIDVGGAAEANTFSGVYVHGGSGTVIGGTTDGHRNVISGNARGIYVGQGTGTTNGLTIRGNYLGVGPDGSTDVGNAVHGIELSNSTIDPDQWTTGTVIGGTTAADRNLISGNGADGIHIEGQGIRGATVQGNYIGLASDGATARGNDGDGIEAPSPSALEVAGVITVGGSQAGRNVIADNGGWGAYLGGTSQQYIVRGNFVGTDAAGTAQRGNDGGGIFVQGDASEIGGTSGTDADGPCAGECNLISGNTGDGLVLFGGGATPVLGNFIGTNAAGTGGLANSERGVYVGGSPDVVTIGGTSAAARNVISGNGSHGIVLDDINARNDVVIGNYIGLGADGTTALGNGQSGIRIGEGSGNTIGGDDPSEGNVIANNGENAVLVVTAQADGNAIQGNRIYDNGWLGIDLGGDGDTQNDPADGDVGPNQEQNFPVISAATAMSSSASVSGSIATSPSQTLRVELFSNDACDVSTYGEGQVFLDAFNVTTNASGNASFSEATPAVPAGDFITATATDSQGNTSEFSECRKALPSISINDQTVTEGNAGTTPATFTVTLSAAATEPVTVNYATANGTATAGTDYQTNNGTVSFATGESQKTISVNVIGDTADEPHETFVVNLSAPTNATVADAQGTGTITDDDLPPQPPPPTPSPTPGPTASCAGKPASIVGTNASETLSGTPGVDVIAGLGGNDVITALGGNDIVCGGDGNDKVNGGSGNDRLLGEAGNDKLKGAAGNDKLIGGPGKDLASGGSGKDKARSSEKIRAVP